MSAQTLLPLDTGLLPETAPYQPCDTSREAAERLRPSLGAKQRAVLRYLATAGPLTDNTLTLHFVGQGWSWHTARPRRIELTQAGYVADTGARQDRCTLWGVTESGRSWLAEEEAI